MIVTGRYFGQKGHGPLTHYANCLNLSLDYKIDETFFFVLRQKAPFAIAFTIPTNDCRPLFLFRILTFVEKLAGLTPAGKVTN